MSTPLQFLFYILLFAQSILSTAIPNTSLNKRQAPITVLHQFAPGSYVENIAVRSNHQLLVVRLDVPEVWQVDPANSQNIKRVARFASATRVTGIVETSPDTFVVIAGKPLLDVALGTWELWELKFPSSSSSDPAIRRVVNNVSGAGLLNGLTVLNGGVLLASDTAKGGIYRIDTKTGASKVTIKDPEGTGFGVNGVRKQGDYLYYTSTLRGGVRKVRVDSSSGQTIGPVQVFGSDTGIGNDDFALSKDGTFAYVANQNRGAILKVDLVNERKATEVFAGRNGDLVGPTAAIISGQTLFVTTAGKGLVSLGSGKGGQVLAVTL